MAAPCEVLSPSTIAAVKLPVYARRVWSTPTRARSRSSNSMWRLIGTFADDARVRAEPFAAFELGALWSR